MTPHRVSAAALKVLAVLDELPGARVFTSAVARASGLLPVTTIALLERFEADGWVESGTGSSWTDGCQNERYYRLTITGATEAHRLKSQPVVRVLLEEADDYQRLVTFLAARGITEEQLHAGIGSST